MEEQIYIALGTNMGDRLCNLCLAREFLLPDVSVINKSSVYITPPWGYVDQPEFCNQVLEIQTTLEPILLLHYLKNIENEMGRVETFRFGPRIIDLDILFYGNQIIDTNELQVPHPHLQDRAFVLVPLNEIASEFIHPTLEKPVSNLLENIDTQGVHLL